MEIPAPPDRPICAGCNEKLVWLYSAKKVHWVAFIVLAEHRLQPHMCDARKPEPWAPNPTAVARNARGRALVTAVLAGDNPFTEETP